MNCVIDGRLLGVDGNYFGLRHGNNRVGLSERCVGLDDFMVGKYGM